MTALSPSTKILLVGVDPAGPECLSRLARAGVKRFTILACGHLDEDTLARNTWLASQPMGTPTAAAISTWLTSHFPELEVDTSSIESSKAISKDWVLSFSLVITMSVEREVELALGDMIFDAGPKALIISRSDEFHGKYRSLYGTYTDESDPEAELLPGVPLSDRPGPPVPEKCERIRRMLTSAMDCSSPELISYLLVIFATGAVFHKTQGYPPAHRPAPVSLAGHEADVEALIRSVIAQKGLSQAFVDAEAIRICCEQGWGGLTLTGTCMGAMIAEEAIILLTRHGRPCDAVPLALAAQAVLEIPVDL